MALDFHRDSTYRERALQFFQPRLIGIRVTHRFGLAMRTLAPRRTNSFRQSLSLMWECRTVLAGKRGNSLRVPVLFSIHRRYGMPPTSNNTINEPTRTTYPIGHKKTTLSHYFIGPTPPHPQPPRHVIVSTSSAPPSRPNAQAPASIRLAAARGGVWRV